MCVCVCVCVLAHLVAEQLWLASYLDPEIWVRSVLVLCMLVRLAARSSCRLAGALDGCVVGERRAPLSRNSVGLLVRVTVRLFAAAGGFTSKEAVEPRGSEEGQQCIGMLSILDEVLHD